MSKSCFLKKNILEHRTMPEESKRPSVESALSDAASGTAQVKRVVSCHGNLLMESYTLVNVYIIMD